VAPSVQRRKVWLTPTTRVPCSNAAKTRNPLKLAGQPQTRQQISAVIGPKFTILSGLVEKVLLFNKFFRLLIRALVVNTSPDKVVQWCQDGTFLAIFWVLHFQRATCSTFQTCILNSHSGHIMCGSMVDIQSATAEIRRGKNKKGRTQKPRQKYNGLPYSIGRP